MKLYATGGNGPRKNSQPIDDSTPVDADGKFEPKKPTPSDADDVASEK